MDESPDKQLSDKDPKPDKCANHFRASLFPFAIMAILVFFDLLQRIAYLFGRNAYLKVVIWANKSVYRALEKWGVRIVIKKFSDFNENRPYIIVSNHQSLFDIAILHTIFANHSPRLVYQKKSFSWLPSLSFNLRYSQNALIDSNNPRRSIAELERLGVLMSERGLAVIIFPEGERAINGELAQFRYAGLSGLLQTAPFAQVIPVTIDGSWKLQSSMVCSCPEDLEIRIAIGAPIERGSNESLKQLIEEIHTVIKGALQQMRSEEKEWCDTQDGV